MALFAALCGVSASAQGVGSFRDVPTTHWAYPDMTELQHAGLLSYYADGYFEGKRTLTRYEFAIAIKRALDRITVASSDSGDVPSLVPAQVKELQRLADEFRHDMSMLGETDRDIDSAFAVLERATAQPMPTAPTRGSKMPTLMPSSDSHGGLFSLGDLHLAGDVSSRSSQFGDPALFTPHPFGGPSLTLSGLGGAFPALLATDASPFAPGAGLRLETPLFHSGQIGFTLQHFTLAPLADDDPHNILTYGTDLMLHPAGRLIVNAGVTRNFVADTSSPLAGLFDNDTYRVGVGYSSGPANAIMGYQVIDPRQPALPNVQGPFTRLSYRFSDSLRSYLGGDLYTGSSGHLFGQDPLSGALLGGNIYRGSAGLRWSPARGLSLSADYSGVLYDLSGDSSLSGRRGQPIEQYITLGAGLNLSRNAVLKLAYQIIDASDSSSDDPTQPHTSSTSVFTTQFAIHF